MGSVWLSWGFGSGWRKEKSGRRRGGELSPRRTDHGGQRFPGDVRQQAAPVESLAYFWPDFVERIHELLIAFHKNAVGFHQFPIGAEQRHDANDLREQGDGVNNREHFHIPPIGCGVR